MIPGCVKEQILELAKDRMPPSEIAALLKVDRPKIYGLLQRARQRGEVIPKFKGGGRAIVGETAAKQLIPAAEARGMTLNELATAILTAVAEGDLVNAVLDDGGEADA